MKRQRLSYTYAPAKTDDVILIHPLEDTKDISMIDMPYLLWKLYHALVLLVPY